MRVAQMRREQELRQLIHEGVPLRTLGKCGHWIVGPLHIYTGSGRWFNEMTGGRGRLNYQQMRQVLDIGFRRRKQAARKKWRSDFAAYNLGT